MRRGIVRKKIELAFERLRAFSHHISRANRRFLDKLSQVSGLKRGVPGTLGLIIALVVITIVLAIIPIIPFVSWTLLVLMAVAFIVFGVAPMYRQSWVETQFALSIFSEDKLRPLESTKRLAATGGLENFTVGGAIEIFRFPLFWGGGTAQGAQPHEVHIRVETEPWSARELPEELHQTPLKDRHNRRKYSVTNVERHLEDRPGCTIFVRETDWNTWIPYKRLIERDENIRHAWFSIEPSRNKLPNSAGLSGIVSFLDDVVLASRRSDDLEFAQGAYSISFEEQFSDFDLYHGGSLLAADFWMKRALCEEVFPLKKNYAADPLAAWAMVDNYLVDRRFLSMICEEPVAGYSMIAHYRLGISSGQFRDLYNHLKQVTKGDSVDPEGLPVFISAANLSCLVEQGYCSCTSASDQKTTFKINNQDLHFTSLYRAILYRALIGP